MAGLLPQVNGEFSGGIEDYGNFKEGYCFKLTEMASNAGETYIICADNPVDKEDWMNAISKVKKKLKT